MSENHLVTKDQIKQLIQDEKLLPEELYDNASLQNWKLRMEIADRLKDEEEAQARNAQNPDAKYLDPAQNPFIKR